MKKDNMTVARLEDLMSSLVGGDIKAKNSDLVLSNKQKSNQLNDWVHSCVVKGQIAGMLKMMSSVVERLPAGNIPVDTGTKDEEGNPILKTCKYRDNSKVKFVKAFNKVVTDKKFPKIVEAWAGQTIKFNDTEVSPVARKAPPTVQDKLTRIFGESLDNKGYQALIATAATHAKRVKNSAATAKARFEKKAIADQIRQHASILAGMDYDKDIVNAMLEKRFNVDTKTVQAAM